MATSSLDPRVVPIPDREIGKGHGTGALGPSDTSDSGSDVRGGAGLPHDAGIRPEGRNTPDRDESRAGNTAGPDIGDANLDSDSDAVGTGEHASAGRDTPIESG
ncbi:MAG TPA: hypothetical protein VHK70_10110, partial [Burkholderiaceae bacterium]|nr:hypothetical protein [Burkholderiaceae bacterium]